MYQVLYLVHTQVALGWLGSVPGALLGAYPGSTRMAWQCSRFCTWCKVTLGWLSSVAGAVLGAYPGSTRMAWQCTRCSTWCIPR